MRSIFTLVILITAITFGNAQDSKAKKILDEASTKTKSYKTIKANFQVTLENKEAGVSETSKGVLLLKGDKYKVEIMGTIVYFDGKVQYTYIPDSEEVNISEPDDENDDFTNPAKIFTIYEKGFNYKFIENRLYGGIKVSIIDLFPTDNEKKFDRVRLYINQKDKMIYEINSFLKDGGNSIITVKSLEKNVNAKDSDFTFNTKAFPDVEVIDMR